MLVGRDGFRLSLAGAQTKLPVVLRCGRVALPEVGEATTHIVKPSQVRFPHITENEAFVMTLAMAAGLPVAAVEGHVIRGMSFLLVARYDRATAADGHVQRLHQEDFCQALGLPPERKYAAEGGPSFKSSFDLLRRVATRPAGAVLTLLDVPVQQGPSNSPSRRPRRVGVPSCVQRYRTGGWGSSFVRQGKRNPVSKAPGSPQDPRRRRSRSRSRPRVDCRGDSGGSRPAWAHLNWSGLTCSPRS